VKYQSRSAIVGSGSQGSLVLCERGGLWERVLTGYDPVGASLGSGTKRAMEVISAGSFAEWGLEYGALERVKDRRGLFVGDASQLVAQLMGVAL